MAGCQLSDVRELISRALHIYRGSPSLRDMLGECEERTRQPLRIAFSGSLKAGKSTLLNALVGEEIAPADATECTKVVTWYRHSRVPGATAWHYADGTHRSSPVVLDRSGGDLTFGLGSLSASEIDCIEVGWPSESLETTMLIDTPGTSSLSRDVSERTLRLLTPEQGPSEADAVIYLLRTLNDADLRFLREIGDRLGGNAGPLGIIGVLARADEVGAGRTDALASARTIADRFARELESTGLCQAVVPVSGLVALAARTLRESEFAALSQLSRENPADLDLALLSADRFVRSPELSVSSETRSALAHRFGVFGIRVAIGLLREGVDTATELAAALLTESGVSELTEAIDVHIRQRAEQLKAHAALVSVQDILARAPMQGSAELLSEVQRWLANDHDFEELRVLARLRGVNSGSLAANARELQRILGGTGTASEVRLGAPAGSSREAIRKLALDSVQRWRGLAQHPMNDPFAAAAYRSAARSAEGILERTQRG
ncbi:dynamin family protein [Hoyosella altamirensis]|uniref:Dynamin N-terminal domain-containing protein n=1 Tax=Hoyosella altamirensis TaxID=616997 RepID=A0A839RU68_9ACTN|nr:hypothetical protein [Hoyosella altamirensis]